MTSTANTTPTGAGITGSITAATTTPSLVTDSSISSDGGIHTVIQFTVISSSTNTNVPSVFSSSASSPSSPTSSSSRSTSSSSSSTSSSSSSTSSSSSSTSSSSSSTSSSHSVAIYPIIGGLSAALVLVLLFIFLFLKHRSKQRKNRRPAETDPQTLATPFRFNIREGPHGYVSVNDGPRSETTGLSSLPMAASTATAPNSMANYASPNTFSKIREKLDARTTYALQPRIRNERIHLATTDPSPNPNQRRFQSNLSNNLITTREGRASHAPTYISNPSESRYQTPLSSISADSGHNSNSAPPAYDSLSSRLSHTNSSQIKS